MRILIFGGGGFVGLNIAEAALAAGHAVTLFDRALPQPALDELAAIGPPCVGVTGDVRDTAAIRAAVDTGIDAVIYGAAITADAARDAEAPEDIIDINLTALVRVLRAARAGGVRRIVNLSSIGALGAAAFPATADLLDETMAADPQSLYGLTKFAGERACARLAALWDLDVRSVRLSAVFGPWERATPVRSTPSPQFQIARCALAGHPATLQRPGVRDWLYAPDVAVAVLRLLEAPAPAHSLYHISTGQPYAALAWGEALAAAAPHAGFECRLARPGEAATVSLYGTADRAIMRTALARADFGFAARWGMRESVAHYARWIATHRWCLEAQA